MKFSCGFGFEIRLKACRKLCNEFQIHHTSVPNPKFVILFSLLGTNFGFDKDTSKSMNLVWFWI